MIGEKNKEIWQSDREPGFAASDSTDSNAQELPVQSCGRGTSFMT
jgi:hypothetical protein